MSQSGYITALLRRWSEGDAQAEGQLMEAIYPELRAIASRRLPGYGPVTLQTTELVHEAYLKLLGQRGVDWQNRAHFFAVAARVLRRVIVDEYRHRSRAKRGGGATHLSFDDVQPATGTPADWLELDEALGRLGRFDPRAERVVELRFFAGLTVDETAHALGLSPATVARGWRFARAWLKGELKRAETTDD